MYDSTITSCTASSENIKEKNLRIFFDKIVGVFCTGKL
jgi:hypothetical protein